MPETSRRIRLFVLVAGDLCVFVVALILALYIRSGGPPDPQIIRLYLLAGPLLFVLWLAGFTMFGLYDLKLTKNEPVFFDRLARAITLDFIITVFLFYTVQAFGLRPFRTLIILFPLLTLFIFLWRNIANAALMRQTRERVLFIGITSEVLELAEFLGQNAQLGYKAAAFMYTEQEEMSGLRTPASTPTFPADETLSSIVQQYNITTVVAAHNLKRTRTLVKALFEVVPMGVTVSDFPRFYEAVRGKVPVSLISETWFLENLIGSRRPRYEFGKRVLDAVLAIVFGTVTLALFPFIALAIILSTPRDIIRHREKRARPGDGIVFFRQERIGKNGKPFGFIKFRSQILGAERFGHEKGEPEDPRAYAIGTFLRKTYLDEFAQLWNVLAGDMSFVGPRPERPEFVQELEKEIPFYRMRELVRPGITGWAQINMANDASVSDAPEKMQYDLYYIKNRSLALDVAILLKTALRLLQRSGR